MSLPEALVGTLGRVEYNQPWENELLVHSLKMPLLNDWSIA